MDRSRWKRRNENMGYDASRQLHSSLYVKLSTVNIDHIQSLEVICMTLYI